MQGGVKRQGSATSMLGQGSQAAGREAPGTDSIGAGKGTEEIDKGGRWLGVEGKHLGATNRSKR